MKFFPWILGVAVGSIALVAVSAELVVNQQNARTFYRDFTRLTKHPHLVAPLTAALCTTPSHAVIEQESRMSGPHYKSQVHLYANPVAIPAITDRKTPFPVGSVIVKEKLADGGTVSGVGGMVKRAAGYDPPNGDWEYFYYGDPGEFTSGRITSCSECHRTAKSTDYVYSVWSVR
jgi:Cytochrome P460